MKQWSLNSEENYYFNESVHFQTYDLKKWPNNLPYIVFFTTGNRWFSLTLEFLHVYYFATSTDYFRKRNTEVCTDLFRHWKLTHPFQSNYVVTVCVNKAKQRKFMIHSLIKLEQQQNRLIKLFMIDKNNHLQTMCV